MTMAPQAKQERPERLTVGVLYGFRAIMVLLVCNYHIWQLGWLPQYFTLLGLQLNVDYITRSSYLFVDGMLLMSGFLLYLPYARQQTEGLPAPSTRQFYLHRVARIVPSYLFSILLLLVLVALPQGAYRDNAALGKDILTHLTFTFNFWPDTYLQTPLNGALWTVAVEMQFYLVFPLLAKATQKKPAITLPLMVAGGIGYRAFLYLSGGNLALLLNQMPAFLDVYALGMLGAMLYARWHRWARKPQNRPSRLYLSLVGMGLFVLASLGISEILRTQSTQSLISIDALRLSQLLLRLPFALCMLWAVLGAAIMPRLLQRVLDNRLMRFLALISYNLYIWHQVLSAQIMTHFFPDTLRGDLPLQRAYTLLCLCASLLAAMAVTYGIEQPSAKAIMRIASRSQKKERLATDTRF